MVDTIGAIAISVLAATVAGVLVGLAQITRRAKVTSLSGFALWGATIITVAAMGGFERGAADTVPVIAYAFAAPLLVGIVAWFQIPRLREIVFGVPLSALIALNIGRAAGVFFVILYAAGRLPAPFAPSAGWGDIFIAASALPLAIVAGSDVAGSGAGHPNLIALWNALGIADLLVAVSLGVMSAAGTPLHVFTAGPDAGPTIGVLPWVVIPALLVPLYLLMHLAIGAKLRAARTATVTSRERSFSGVTG